MRPLLAALAAVLLAPAAAGAQERTYEPNDTLATAAGPLLADTTYASANDEPLQEDADGGNARNEDVDWFVFHTSGPAKVRVTYVLDAIGNCFGPVVTLRAADGTALDSAQPNPGEPHDFTTTAAAAGTFYLELVPYHIGTCTETNSPYRFRVALTPVVKGQSQPTTVAPTGGQAYLPPAPFVVPPAAQQKAPRLKVSSLRFRKGRLRVRGKLAAGADPRKVQVTAFSGGRTWKLNGRSGTGRAWLASGRAPRRLRSAKKLRVSVSFAGGGVFTAQTLAARTVRRKR